MKKILAQLRNAFEKDKIIPFLFNFLFFILPLTFLPITSELFEFNKIILVYLFTVLIAGIWLAKMVILKKVLFKRSILDIPLLLFLVSQIASTVFSIDRYTSIFGYYSRWNGGLVSTISYLTLYWAFVSNMHALETKRLFKTILASGVIVSLWASLEHFGLSPSCVLLRGEWNASCWVQDVQTRVFATMGQPNWLAAYLTPLAPLASSLALAAGRKHKALTLKNYWIYYLINLLFFATVLFTKSRSGILAFIIANIVFWIITLIKSEQKNITRKVLIISQSIIIVLGLLFGTPWTPSLKQIVTREQPKEAIIVSPAGNVIELDGTESGTLRQIVWRGSFDIWRAYPLFGTGVETFAFSYYQFRPIDHNLTSEWDFLYNKAHNEFLNHAANSGTLGLLAYLSVIAIFVVWALKNSSNNYVIALFAGFISLCVTNFFGFSVVVTALQFFLLMAFGISLVAHRKPINIEFARINSHQKIFLSMILLAGIVAFFLIIRYWYADVLYARGKGLLGSGEIPKSNASLQKAVALSPFVASYHDQLAQSYAQAAIVEDDEANSLLLAQKAKAAADKAYELSPRNINIGKSRSNLFVDLSQIKADYLLDSITSLQRLMVYAPTDPSIYQMMGLSLASAGYLDQAEKFMLEAVELKPDYKRARMTLNYLYQQQGKFEQAREQLQYILDNISPDDSSVKQQLQDLDSL